MPLVSLIIPAFDAADYLDATLRSVSRQDLADFECLVVDDFSGDDTVRIASRWRARDQRIRLIEQRARSGVSAARNAGLRAAQGALCTFLDADDLLMADSLRVRFEAWQAASRAAGDQAARLAGSYCASETIAHHVTRAPMSRPAALAPVGFVTAAGGCPFNANQPMIRRDVLLELGGFNEAMAQAEDYDLWARILRAGYWFAPAPRVAVTYRARAGSAVRKAPAQHLAASLALHDAGQRALGADTLSRSPGRLVRPQAAYAHQATKAPRILQFCGMELASDDARPVDEIAAQIDRHLPDLSVLLAPTTSVRGLLGAGIARQRGAAATPQDEARLASLLAALGALGARAKAGAPGPESADFGPYGIPERDRPWHPDRDTDIDVLFLPHKDYHAWTVGLAAPALRAAGVRFAVADLAPQWREAGTAARAAQMDLPLLRWGEIALGGLAPRLIVTFNDWDSVTRPILIAAQDAGIPTAAIVEGIQDYDDADTGRVRHAYRVAETVLLPGEFDRRYFTRGQARPGAGAPPVVGVPRIQLMRRQTAGTADKAAARAAGRRVLINSNFSHNVMTDRRDGWLTQAVEAVRRAGLTPVISRHPEDLGELFPELATTASFYDTLDGSCATVQRFASGILESLAARVPVIYFNPHGEKVDKFSDDPMGAYPVALTQDALAERLARLDEWRDAALARADAFLDHHAGALDLDSGGAIAQGLRAAMGPRPDPATCARFRRNLRIVDGLTEALTRREPLFDHAPDARARMAALAAADVSPQRMAADAVGAAVERARASSRGGLVWRSRMAVHLSLERAYRGSARWPWLHRIAQRAAARYKRGAAPI